jgi:hypothetical protein
VNGSESEKKKRMRFTDEEKKAISEGFDKHGKGNWAMIKKDYAHVLANRTSVQIKVIGWKSVFIQT